MVRLSREASGKELIEKKKRLKLESVVTLREEKKDEGLLGMGWGLIYNTIMALEDLVEHII
jgi:hypothetical protein